MTDEKQVYTVYQEETFGLWGIVRPDGTQEPAGYDTQGDAQDYADARNAGCTTQDEVDAFIASRLPQEPELTPQEWFNNLRTSLATIRAQLHDAAGEVQNAEIKCFLALSEAGLDPETVEKKRAALLAEKGLTHAANVAAAKRDVLEQQAREYETILKDYALQVYGETQNKQLGGVTINDTKTLHLLVPEAKALEYGQKYFPNLVETITKWTHKSKFMAAIRQRLDKELDDEVITIAELVSTPSAVVATDLSEYAQEIEAEEAPPGFVEETDIPF